MIDILKLQKGEMVEFYMDGDLDVGLQLNDNKSASFTIPKKQLNAKQVDTIFQFKLNECREKGE